MPYMPAHRFVARVAVESVIVVVVVVNSASSLVSICLAQSELKLAKIEVWLQPLRAHSLQGMWAQK